MALISLDEPDEYSEWAAYIESLGNSIFQALIHTDIFIFWCIHRTATDDILDFGLENYRDVAVEMELN
jgi:hypothetical protein